MPATYRFEPPWIPVPAGTAVAFRNTNHLRHAVSVTTGRSGRITFRETDEYECVYAYWAEDVSGLAVPGEPRSSPLCPEPSSRVHGSKK